MAASDIRVRIDMRARRFHMAVIFVGHLAIRFGADIDKTTAWILRNAFVIEVR